MIEVRRRNEEGGSSAQSAVIEVRRRNEEGGCGAQCAVMKSHVGCTSYISPSSSL
ncbi:MAG: hypothetical protein IJL54_10820 [Prevotella sp.]|nr:hypothetical protein [Prevotella sp.]